MIDTHFFYTYLYAEIQQVINVVKKLILFNKLIY